MGSIAAAVVKDQTIHQPRRIRIIVIGAGISGIAFAYKIKALENVEYQIYEKNEDVGGTWFESRYPGCSCDIPAHSYTYPWVGNPNWSRLYAGAEEIWKFYRDRAEEYGVYETTKFNHKVVGATWNEENGRWMIKVEDLKTGLATEDSAEVLINCAGVLNKWKWPDIQGLQSFGGTLVHSARYPQELDLAGKTVGVIGAGSSGIQIVPTIQPIVKALISFNRSPTWIAPQFAGHLASAGRQTMYTEEEKERFRNDPEQLLKYRQEIDQVINSRFPNFYKGSEEQKASRAIVEKGMRERLSKMDPELREKLIPDFDVGCRRVTPGDGYLEALQEPNVQVVRTRIQEVNEESIVTADGISHAVDVIIAATGYDTSYVPPFPLVGRNGVDLGKRWAQTGAEAYLTCAVPDMPNYFSEYTLSKGEALRTFSYVILVTVVVGPNTPISNGSLMPAIESQLEFALTFAKKIQRESVKSVVVSQQATTEFNDHKDAVMELLTFSGNCNSWYKGGTSNGRITGPWCGSLNHFLESIAEPRLQDFEFTYDHGNRFEYLGRGLSRKDVEKKDLAWYIH
ncbi:Flavin-binding monooxygenase-like family protein [Penicillium riverlandense]|uniref:Flavin-binding monooxygenase-like family protein n=1 Tax=Penicillium riverlandense TaxID=1903569 RepID=UPI0025499CEA|nr:Flavin-binding monooxygenase-like family protein [Penicillium riverlandense]KAJ5818015.1 Flavin-binding monooxygenase-like family protein [Penicillium riverlandense]